MATKIVFSPPMPKDIMDACRAMVPQGYELTVVERGVAGELEAHRDAEYFVGFARGDMGPDFYKTLPKLKLIQLISAGYDRLDIAAAKAAGVPVANNGGANSTAVAEHTWLLILGVLKRLAWQHANVVAGKWRIGDLELEPGGQERAGDVDERGRELRRENDLGGHGGLLNLVTGASSCPRESST